MFELFRMNLHEKEMMGSVENVEYEEYNISFEDETETESAEANNAGSAKNEGGYMVYTFPIIFPFF